MLSSGLQDFQLPAYWQVTTTQIQVLENYPEVKIKYILNNYLSNRFRTRIKGVLVPIQVNLVTEYAIEQRLEFILVVCSMFL